MNGEADLVEEIVRIYGLDKVAHVPLPRLADGHGAPHHAPRSAAASSPPARSPRAA